MQYTLAKEKFDNALKAAEAEFSALGVKVLSELDVVENELDGGESEVIMLFGSLGLSYDGFSEDDVYYLSLEAKVYADEIEDGTVCDALSRFSSEVSGILERLKDSTDPAETLKLLGKEVDEELEREAKEALLRETRAVKRDLIRAIIVTVAVFAIAIISVIISKLVN